MGLVCGSDAAAKRDVVETAQKRYPAVRFRIVEAAVQGAGAAAGVAAALRALDADPFVDVIVLARGGGSVEDLLPFSDEALCRAVAECATPVVTAIGHEQDTPLVDLVADVRAGTPSLAAKLVVPDHAAVCAELDGLAARAGRALEGRTANARRHLQLLAARPAFADPRSWITTRRTLLDGAEASLRRLPALRLEREVARLVNARDRLRVLGPGATLERGYAIVQDDAGAVVRDAGAVAVGQHVGVRLGTGRLGARGRGGADVSEELGFEQARDELEQIVRKLEDGSTPLDEALALWERGEQLHALCRARLDAAEERVTELLERLGRSPTP